MFMQVDNSSFIKGLMAKKQGETTEEFFTLLEKRKELLNETKKFLLDDYSVVGILKTVTEITVLVSVIVCLILGAYASITLNFIPFFVGVGFCSVSYVFSLWHSFKARPKFFLIKNQIKEIEKNMENMDDKQKIEFLKRLLPEVMTTAVEESFDKIINYLSKDNLYSTFYNEMDNFIARIAEQNIQDKETEKSNQFKAKLGLLTKENKKIELQLNSLEKYQDLL